MPCKMFAFCSAVPEPRLQHNVTSSVFCCLLDCHCILQVQHRLHKSKVGYAALVYKLGPDKACCSIHTLAFCNARACSDMCCWEGAHAVVVRAHCQQCCPPCLTACPAIRNAPNQGHTALVTTGTMGTCLPSSSMYLQSSSHFRSRPS